MFRYCRQDASRIPRARNVASWAFVQRAIEVGAGAMLAVAWFAPCSEGQTIYWDVNGAGDGATDTSSASGTWDDFGHAFWTTDSTGQSATTNFSGGAVVFSAGDDATGTSTVTLSGFNKTISGLTIQEGTVVLTGSSVTLSNGSSPAFIANGAAFDKRVSMTATGTMTIDGGTFIRPTWGGPLAVTSNGATLDAPTPPSGSGYAVTGAINMAPGVTSATVTKSGPAEVQARSTGDFTTLNVNAGTYRATTSDLGFGAASGTVYVADGAAVGAGVTFKPITSPTTRSFVLNGNAAFTSGDTWTINSPISGSGNFLLGSSLTSDTSPAVKLAGANSYAGSTVINKGTLSVDGGSAIPDTSAVTVSSAKLSILDDEAVGSISGTSAASIEFGVSGKTLTAGGDNTSTHWAGSFSGSNLGVIRKVGTGTLTLDGNAQLGSNSLAVAEGMVDVRSSTAISSLGGLVIGDNSGGPDVLTVNAGSFFHSGQITVDGTTATLALGANHTAFTYFMTLQDGGSVTGSGTAHVDSITSFELKSGSSDFPFSGQGTLSKTTAGTVTLNGLNAYTGGTNVSAGLLRVKRLQESNAVSITGGTLQVMDSSPTLPATPSGDNTFVSRPGSLTSDASFAIANDNAPLGARVYNGTLDLGNNDLIIDYSGASPYASLQDMLRSGFNGGTWTGTGITSSTAANALANNNYALGIAENGTLVTPFGDGTGVNQQFSGQTVDNTTVLIKFTHRADLNLDGVITSNDAAVFNSSYQQGASGATWQTGDLNYNGIWDSNDAAIFNSFYNESLAHLPEPSVVLPLCAVAFGRRTRRRVA